MAHNRTAATNNGTQQCSSYLQAAVVPATKVCGLTDSLIRWDSQPLLCLYARDHPPSRSTCQRVGVKRGLFLQRVLWSHLATASVARVDGQLPWWTPRQPCCSISAIHARSAGGHRLGLRKDRGGDGAVLTCKG